MTSNSVTVATSRLRATVAADGGHLESLEGACESGWKRIDFRSDAHRGPAWYCRSRGSEEPVPLRITDRARLKFEGDLGSLRFSLRYDLRGDQLALTAAIRNMGAGVAHPLRAGLRLGLDTYMEKFPDWNDKFFPTLLRCEKTHFWGYAMTPRGRILGIASPDAVASWHLDYKGLEHRIYTLCLDLLHPGPLPTRHPQNLDTLQPGEQRQWTILLEEIPSLQLIKPRLAAATGAPMLECDRCTVEPGEAINLTLHGGPSRVELLTPEGGLSPIEPAAPFHPGDTPGLYTLRATSPNGKIAEAIVTVRRPWSWYLKRARAEALAKPQKASSHTESWYGFFSCFLAQRHFPDSALDARAKAKFEEIWPLMYDMQTMTPTSWQNRVQNHACAAGLMAARYRATGDIRDLEFAASLADFLLTRQSADGAYRNGSVHYTSVVYIGKSILEVLAEEKKLAASDAAWKARYDRHYDSVRRAMDELARNLDNIQTEGEMTYEDGMISCSYSQLAQFALWQEDPILRQKYLQAAAHLAGGHRCLSQILVPDSRMNGASLRFWEAQYDILTTPNMLNSPHGWSAWRIYGLHYLYQLTGEEEHLRQAMNGLGACAQLIDADTGELRWAFVPDPHVEALHFEEFPDSPGKGRSVPRVIGEQYLPMISGWYRARPDTWVTGYWGGASDAALPPGESWPAVWGPIDGSARPVGGDGGCCDNDVHEIFKCLEEVALTSAYVVEREDGRIAAWNCRVSAGAEGQMIVTPSEEIVSRVHLNLRAGHSVRICFAGGRTLNATVKGMKWLYPDGPEMPGGAR